MTLLYIWKTQDNRKKTCFFSTCHYPPSFSALLCLALSPGGISGSSLPSGFQWEALVEDQRFREGSGVSSLFPLCVPGSGSPSSTPQPPLGAFSSCSSSHGTDGTVSPLCSSRPASVPASHQGWSMHASTALVGSLNLAYTFIKGSPFKACGYQASDWCFSPQERTHLILVSSSLSFLLDQN